MYDARWIREHPRQFDEGLDRRGLEPLADRVIALADEHRQLVTELQRIQERRNTISKEVGQAKSAGDEARAQELMREVSRLKSTNPEITHKLLDLETQLRNLVSSIPNMPLDEVPIGVDEHGNVERHRHGLPRAYTFGPKEHFELGEALGQMDFEVAAKLSGARFVVLKRDLARLERALGQYMIDKHTMEHGYTEVSPPILVREDTMFGTTQLPKFADDQFRVSPGDLWLIPTAEVSLTNLVREAITDEAELPMRLTALTQCFRAEAGAAGRDTRGMIRQHQFQKVELVSITTPEQSMAEHERMLDAAEAVLKGLDLHYRVMTLCTGDMGFASQKTYDIEVWLPGQGAFREISSCSICGDFQARRMNARSRPRSGGAPRFVHTLNGSGVAVGRALVAVLETYQNEDGSITIPDVLIPYMGGPKRIGPAH